MTPSPLARDCRSRLSSSQIIAPGEPDYERLRKVWNATIDRRPAVIVRPGTSAEVAAAIRLAAGAEVPLAIRCGGHSFPGFSTCEAGILLDLGRLNRVSVDPAARLAEIGGGALLGDLDRATTPHGLVTPAGLVSHTGVGGLTLGGGMGWVSRRLGLTVDSLVWAELVTAGGEIIEVDAVREPDLFWAIRGGGGNFGVVTRFRFRLHPLGPVTVGNWDYPPDRAEAALNRLGAIAPTAPRSVTTTTSLTTTGLRVTAFHSGTVEPGRDSVLPYGALAGPGRGGLTGQSYVELQSRSDEGARWGLRYYGRGGFFAGLDQAIAGRMVGEMGNAPDPDAEIYTIQLGGAVSDVAEDATAYSGRRAQFFWIVQPIWENLADDARHLAWGREAGTAMAALSSAGNYVNEQADTGTSVARSAYGAAKFDRLARLKARYDPTNLFRLNQNIAPAVATAS